MDIFVLPSDYEGMPFVLLEALASGLPIVTTDIGGAETTVEHGTNGLIVPRRDRRQLADALKTVALCADLRHTMGCASQERAKRFSRDRMVSDTISVYDEFLRPTRLA
jgi:glycosyltransferase involved in cell wall biosynthesis